MPCFRPSRKNISDLPTDLANVIVIDELDKIKDKWEKSYAYDESKIARKLSKDIYKIFSSYNQNKQNRFFLVLHQKTIKYL